MVLGMDHHNTSMCREVYSIPPISDNCYSASRDCHSTTSKEFCARLRDGGASSVVLSSGQRSCYARHSGMLDHVCNASSQAVVSRCLVTCVRCVCWPHGPSSIVTRWQAKVTVETTPQPDTWERDMVLLAQADSRTTQPVGRADS